MIEATRTFGAVVLTLKATGWSLLFVTLSTRFTSCVNGPSGVQIPQSQSNLPFPKTMAAIVDALLKPNVELGLRETDMVRE